MKMLIPILKLAAILGCFIVGEVSAFTHIVGGSNGWRVPKNLSYYEDWSKPRTFGVGDKLVFPSRPMGNNVVMVSQEDFGPCTQNKILAMYYEGPLILTLNHTGEYYFYSGIGKHCEKGQKLHVTVGEKEGSSGDLSPFKLYATGENYGPSYSFAPSQLPKPLNLSSATTIRNFGGISVGLLLLTFLLFLLI